MGFHFSIMFGDLQPPVPVSRNPNHNRVWFSQPVPEAELEFYFFFSEENEPPIKFQVPFTNGTGTKTFRGAPKKKKD
jgi:hypothetical protein